MVYEGRQCGLLDQVRDALPGSAPRISWAQVSFNRLDVVVEVGEDLGIVSRAVIEDAYSSALRERGAGDVVPDEPYACF